MAARTHLDARGAIALAPGCPVRIRAAGHVAATDADDVPTIAHPAGINENTRTARLFQPHFTDATACAHDRRSGIGIHAKTDPRTDRADRFHPLPPRADPRIGIRMYRASGPIHAIAKQRAPDTCEIPRRRSIHPWRNLMRTRGREPCSLPTTSGDANPFRSIPLQEPRMNTSKITLAFAALALTASAYAASPADTVAGHYDVQSANPAVSLAPMAKTRTEVRQELAAARQSGELETLRKIYSGH
ncbi:DUF4148 domain-containing protein [Burkholderia territorii]|uniref:DUF4148 domain-containing protein n=1 Tax=Burkholderia territorii TaxID=1503055 RepID=UPI001E461BF8|nr:DUF4148 domain-containing protein [Burkholderia territorii]